MRAAPGAGRICGEESIKSLLRKTSRREMVNAVYR